MKHKIPHTVLTILASFCMVISFGQSVTLPDTNFRNFIKKTYPSVINANGQLVIAEAAKVTGTVDGSNLPIKSIEGIQYFTSIWGINFVRTGLTYIPDLSNLSRLESMNLMYNSLTFLPSLSKAKRLKSLNVHSNKLPKLPNLDQNDSLQELNVNNNVLDSLPDLSNLLQLQKLYVHNNKIKKLIGIEKLISLTDFWCYSNQLGDFPLLDNLKKLTWFDASKNQLRSAPDFGKNSNIQIIDIDQNNIETLPDYSGYTNLKKVTLDKNRLTFKELTKLLSIPKYDSIFKLMPQQTLIIGQTLYLKEGQPFVFSTGVDTGIQNIRYNWYKKSALQKSDTSDKWTIPYVMLQDSGNYSVRIYHSRFPDFYLPTDSFTIKTQPCLDMSLVSTAVTEINCQKTGTIEISYPLSNGLVYELRSPATGKVLSSTTGKIAGLTEPSYFLSIKSASGCTREYPKEIKIPTQKCKDYLITPDNDGNADTFFFEASGKAEIYDKRGNMVKRLTIPAEWDCSSDKGKVASGYYIANINDGESQIGLSVVY